MVRQYFEIQNSGAFKPGDEIWAFAFVYANDKTNKANFQTPILGQLQDRNQDWPPNRQKPDYKFTPFTPIQYFVPYQKNKKKLAWSRAVRVEARTYADSETEAQIAYNQAIEMAQNWHYLRSILLNELYTDLPASDRHVLNIADKPGLLARTWRQFMDDVASGSITEKTKCYLSPGIERVLDIPLKLDHERGIATVVYETSAQRIEFQVNYEDLGRQLCYESGIAWRPESGSTVIYREV